MNNPFWILLATGKVAPCRTCKSNLKVPRNNLVPIAPTGVHIRFDAELVQRPGTPSRSDTTVLAQAN